MSKKGKFIVIEGGDGSGKGTIVEHLRNAFRQLPGEPVRVIFTREPGGTELGEKIRTLLLSESMSTQAELLLFEAARAEHLDKRIIPALDAGIHVISDRFDASTYAYQVIARWRGKHEAFFETVNKEVVGRRHPDLYLFCDIRPEASLARRMAAEGEKSRFDLEEKDFHERVYRGYRDFFSRTDIPTVYIDAMQDIATMTGAAEAIVRTELGL